MKIEVVVSEPTTVEYEVAEIRIKTERHSQSTDYYVEFFSKAGKRVTSHQVNSIEDGIVYVVRNLLRQTDDWKA